MSFADTLHCQSRTHCMACRNAEGFRKKLEAEFGPIICPLGIEIGTQLLDMPDEAKNAGMLKFTGPVATAFAAELVSEATRLIPVVNTLRNTLQDPEHVAQADKLMKFVQTVINNSQKWSGKIWPDEVHKHIKGPIGGDGIVSNFADGRQNPASDIVKSRIPYHSPVMQASSLCVRGLQRIGEKEEECCGGKKKTVPVYGCTLRGSITDKGCRMCPAFLKKDRQVPTSGIFDLLVSVTECEDCQAVKSALTKLKGAERPLVVVEFLGDSAVREYLDGALNRSDLYSPALFVKFDASTLLYERAIDDMDDIVEYLKSQGCSAG